MYVSPISTRLLRGMLMPAMRAIAYALLQPCRCLWRGFWQITRTRPWRRMILHFSHIGLTDGRTFMCPFGRDPGAGALAAGAAAATSSRMKLEVPRRRSYPLRARPSRIARPDPGALALSSRRGEADGLVPRGEDPRAAGGDGDRELEVGGQRPVLGVDRPAVVAHADLVAARVDHRLDREAHARLEQRALAGIAVVGDLRLLVHLAADAVADERADDRQALALDRLLDSV